MVPQRFVTEYPHRCGQLLDMLEQDARGADLLGSFSLLIASAAFTIPFGRLTEANHPLGNTEPRLSRAIKKLRGTEFVSAPFWREEAPTSFRYALIVNNPQNPDSWRDEDGTHPIKSTKSKDTSTVLRTVRNALAHGNVVFLNENGKEAPGSRVRYLAFLSRHERDEAYHRVVIFDEEGFIAFLKSWIAWLQEFPSETKFVFGEDTT